MAVHFSPANKNFKNFGKTFLLPKRRNTTKYVDMHTVTAEIEDEDYNFVYRKTVIPDKFPIIKSRSTETAATTLHKISWQPKGTWCSASNNITAKLDNIENVFDRLRPTIHQNNLKSIKGIMLESPCRDGVLINYYSKLYRRKLKQYADMQYTI